ncbi:MAG: hypothetical protein QUV20_00500 [Oceanibaculum nanhaiense]|uniref:hypothetical protein n=1 Tax=Oceanibaculum nanhaiense TaxID=1909734 RepID=UPI0025A336C1|nr:hypothetical protein [Oceanibaculum nanhaiense]MDM7944786.1 hypothetical protein [Oceanibaculum nanhaiense]
MSREHLKKKAQEALKEADGNASLAARLLHGWALEDRELLQALVKPMLPSLSLLAVQRAAGKDDGYRASRRRRSPPVTEKAALEAVAEALSGKRAPAMSSTRTPLTAPSEASTRHRSAVQFLASAYKPKS